MNKAFLDILYNIRNEQQLNIDALKERLCHDQPAPCTKCGDNLVGNLKEKKQREEKQLYETNQLIEKYLELHK